jgi:hypothetical protein
MAISFYFSLKYSDFEPFFSTKKITPISRIQIAFLFRSPIDQNSPPREKKKHTHTHTPRLQHVLKVITK